MNIKYAICKHRTPTDLHYRVVALLPIGGFLYGVPVVDGEAGWPMEYPSIFKARCAAHSLGTIAPRTYEPDSDAPQIVPLMESSILSSSRWTVTAAGRRLAGAVASFIGVFKIAS